MNQEQLIKVSLYNYAGICVGVARVHSEDEIEDAIKELGPLTIGDSIEIELEQ